MVRHAGTERAFSDKTEKFSNNCSTFDGTHVTLKDTEKSKKRPGFVVFPALFTYNSPLHPAEYPVKLFCQRCIKYSDTKK